MFGTPPDGEKRYSPAECTGCMARAIEGQPDVRDISTGYAERQNPATRMRMRRFTRPANAFGKKAKNLEYAVSLHFLHSNFARNHKTLGVTPAMEAGVTDSAWDLEEIAAFT